MLLPKDKGTVMGGKCHCSLSFTGKKKKSLFLVKITQRLPLDKRIRKRGVQLSVMGVYILTYMPKI